MYNSFINFGNPLYILVRNDTPEEALAIISKNWRIGSASKSVQITNGPMM